LLCALLSLRMTICYSHHEREVEEVRLIELLVLLERRGVNKMARSMVFIWAIRTH
jgi:hypothetical protein